MSAISLERLRGTDGHRMPKTSEIIARDLTNFIVDNGIAEGTRLPTEQVLLDELKVSRPTLREALRLLETRGVVVVRSGRNGGPVVCRPRAHELGQVRSLIMQFEKTSFADIVHTRRAMEPMMARLAAQHATSEGLAEIRAANEAIAANLDDQATFRIENQRFHTGIAEMANNGVLRLFTEALNLIADGISSDAEHFPKRVRAVTQAHERIIEALEAGNPDAAEQAMSTHISEVDSFWQSYQGRRYENPVRWTGQ